MATSRASGASRRIPRGGARRRTSDLSMPRPRPCQSGGVGPQREPHRESCLQNSFLFIAAEKLFAFLGLSGGPGGRHSLKLGRNHASAALGKGAPCWGVASRTLRKGRPERSSQNWRALGLTAYKLFCLIGALSRLAAGLAELVDALDSKSSSSECGFESHSRYEADVSRCGASAFFHGPE